MVVGSLLFSGCGTSRTGSEPDSDRSELQRPAGTDPVIFVVGDSYTSGSAMDSGPESNWSALMADELRRDRPDLRMEVEAGGGSGYTTGGMRGLVFEQLAGLSMPADPTLIIVFGSLNDSSSGASSVGVAARSLLRRLRTDRPDAIVLVIGPPWMDERVPANLLLVRDAVRTASQDAGALFIDPLAEGWFSGESAALIGADGVHPSDAGQRHLADLITPRVAELLGARSTP